MNPQLRTLGVLCLTLLAGLAAVFMVIGDLKLARSQETKSDGFITTNGRSFTRDNQSFIIKGMNYYPKDYPWEAMWLHYDEITVSQQISTELDIARKLGVNTVRLFTPYRLFSGTVSSPYPNYLADFVNRLEAQNMAAIVTFFDFYPSAVISPYTTINYPADKMHIDTVVDALGDANPAVMAWDIKNEIDFDYNMPVSETIVKAWANEMISYTRSVDPNHLITIGFNGSTPGTLCYNSTIAATEYDPTIAAEFASAVDFISLHYFLSERCYEEDLKALQSLVGDKPIVLEEFGLHTKADATDPHTESEQAAYYNVLLSLSEAYNLAGVLFWTLNDLQNIPDNFPETEQCLGILRNNNVTICEATNPITYSQKAAAEVVLRHYAPQVAYLDLFNGLVDPKTDAPPVGWSDNWQQGGGLLRGYNPNLLPPPLWSHTPGHVAFSKFVSNGLSIPGLAASPILTNVNIDQTPLLKGRVTSYAIREASGSDSTLYIGIQEGGQITRLLTITPGTPLPLNFNLDMRQPPLHWQGNRSFQITLELVADAGGDGYSATYEFDWLTIEELRHLYLPMITRSPFTLDDFEDGQDPNLIGGPIEWFGPCVLSAPGGYSPSNPHSGNVGYRLTYSVTSTCYATWQTGLQGYDYSDFNEVTFWVKGESGGESANIYLQNTPTQRSYVDIEKYLSEANNITTNWQQVRIPLSDFAEGGVDLIHLIWFQIVFEWSNMNGTIYIDDIRFE